MKHKMVPQHPPTLIEITGDYEDFGDTEDKVFNF
jgi:hypothetical protein